MKLIFKKPLFYVVAIIIIIIAAIIFHQPAKPNYETATATMADIARQVSVTGSVKPAEDVDLAFEVSGKIKSAPIKVGDQVKAGQKLAELDNNDLIAQFNQALASLANEQAKLADLKNGIRSEEIQIAQTAVQNAQISLINAKTNLDNAQNKATVDLNNIYDGVRDVLQDSYAKADDAVNKQVDDLFNTTDPLDPKISFFTADSVKQSIAENQRIEADMALKNFKLEIDSISVNQTFLDKALNNAENNLAIIRNFLTTLNSLMNSTVSLSATDIAAYKAGINTGRTNVNTAITNVNAKIQAIAGQQALNKSNLSAAETSVNTAANTLAAAIDNLNLKNAGYTANQIASQEALVKYAAANVSNSQAKISKTIIYAPISGIITQQDAKIGEIISASKIIISIMSDANFEIETAVPETDIVDVKINDQAKITLDAYGTGQLFNAIVSAIDPAETIIDNVATYKVTLQFTNKDSRLKSGLTANIEIETATKKNILVIPQRAIIRRGLDQFVSIDAGGSTPVEKKIETGLRGSDGNVEIISGLNEGDKVITSTL